MTMQATANRTEEQVTAKVNAANEGSGEEVFIFPATVGQHRFWLLDQLDPGNPALNVPLAARLTGRLNRELLELVVNEIINRHEILRTSFRTTEGELVQVIHQEKKIQMAGFDLTLCPEAEREKHANKLILEEGKISFVLAKGPLLRASLINLRDDEHILLLTMHHIACDGWSNGLIIREVAHLYGAFSEARQIPELPLQYADFAVWQKEWLEGTDNVGQHKFWQNQLQGILPYLNLPTDYPRKSNRSHNSTLHTLLLPQPLTQALKGYCNRENLTPFMVFFATYAILLYRYSGQRDIIVGSPAANRNQPNLEGLIGLFSNPLLIRLKFYPDLTLQALLRQVKTLSLEVFDHQAYPFEKMMEEIETDSNRSGLQWLQAYIVFQKAFMQPQQMANVTLTPLRSISPGTLFEWMLGVLERAEGIRLQLEYNTDLFDQSTIDRMLHHFQQLLETVVTGQDVRIDDLPILVPEESQQLVCDWNKNQLELPQHRCVHELFEEQVARAPDALALRNEVLQISYSELNRRANKMAHLLIEHGIRLNSHVGLVMDQCSAEFPVWFLAILKAGGCCIVLDLPSDAGVLDRLVNHDGLEFVVARRNHLNTLSPSTELRIIDFDMEAKLVDGLPETNLSTPTSDEHPACVRFTSGFSGSKSGAIISHRALLNSAMISRNELRLTSKDRVMFSLNEMLPALLAGTTLVFPAYVQRFNAMNWWQWACSQRITVAALPTTWWHELVESLAPDWATVSVDLRLLAIGGSQISPATLSTWERATSGRIRLLNRFMLAEAAGPVAFLDPLGPDSFSGRVSIAHPAPNRRIYLLDANLKPVPIGVPGSLYIGSNCLAVDDLAGSELLAANYVTDPFSEKPGDRLLKTGDTGRFLPSGGIELLGRIEDLVKTNGYRLELCEIRSTLFEHPGVRDALVVPQEISGKKKIIAYWVNDQKIPVQAEELRAFMVNRLPAYMVPSAFMAVSALPLTSNGKIDRKALPIPGKSQLDQNDRFLAPSTQTEVALAKIWCKVLGVHQIGVRENFFTSGGNSLLAIRMVNEIRRQLAPGTPIRMPFQYPTIQELAKALLNQKFTERKSEIIELQAGRSGPEIFLIVDGDSVGLFKLSRHLDKELRLRASVVPLSESAIKASAERQYSALPRMEDMAAEHVSLIKSRHPSSPVVLVGYCMAGTIAFEAARQLQAAGIKVEAVLMLNTWMQRPTWWWRKKAWLREHLGKLLQKGPNYLLHKFHKRISKERPDLVAQSNFTSLDDFNIQTLNSIVTRINRHAVVGYRQEPLASRGVLFVFEDDWKSKAYLSTDPSLGANGLFQGGLEVINVPANNVTVLDEAHLATVAGYFNKCVRQFQ